MNVADLKVKVDVVTGSGSGIGKATAKAETTLVLGSQDVGRSEEGAQVIRRGGAGPFFTKRM